MNQVVFLFIGETKQTTKTAKDTEEKENEDESHLRCFDTVGFISCFVSYLFARSLDRSLKPNIASNATTSGTLHMIRATRTASLAHPSQVGEVRPLYMRYNTVRTIRHLSFHILIPSFLKLSLTSSLFISIQDRRWFPANCFKGTVTSCLMVSVCRLTCCIC